MPSGRCRARSAAAAACRWRRTRYGTATSLRIDAALGHAVELSRPLLRTRLQARVGTDAEAQALGDSAAAQLRADGADSYLAAAG